MSYQDAKTQRDKLDARVRELSAALNTFPKRADGLTPDHIKFSPDYRAVKTAYDSAFKALRQFNINFNRVFKKEIRAERRNRKPTGE